MARHSAVARALASALLRRGHMTLRMRRANLATLLVAGGALSAAAAGAGTLELRRAPGSIELQAVHASVSDVLERIAPAADIRLAFDGADRVPPVTLHLKERDPLALVQAVLREAGLDYALRTDAAGTGLDTLVVVRRGGEISPGAAALAESESSGTEPALASAAPAANDPSFPLDAPIPTSLSAPEPPHTAAERGPRPPQLDAPRWLRQRR
jgi:hypothetical protein